MKFDYTSQFKHDVVIQQGFHKIMIIMPFHRLKEKMVKVDCPKSKERMKYVLTNSNLSLIHHKWSDQEMDNHFS